MGIITLLTDFGSFYPSVMKAVIFSIAPSANVIDITHDVSPQKATEGSFILREIVKSFHMVMSISPSSTRPWGQRDADSLWKPEASTSLDLIMGS